MTAHPDWHSVADLVWAGMTVPDACKELGYDWREASKLMPITVKRYMVDVSMLANCRDEYIGEEE
jgi:hypothetical protein